MNRFIMVLSLMLLSCASTRMMGVTGFSIQSADGWVLMPSPAAPLLNQIESIAVGNQHANSLIIFTAIDKMDIQPLVFNLWMSVIGQPELAVSVTQPCASLLIQGGIGFDVSGKSSHVHIIVVNGSKYTYVIQAFAGVDELPPTTIRLIKSFTAL